MSEKLPIIGRERALINALANEIWKLVRDPVRDPIEGRRDSSFEVLIHVDGQPTGHVARVTVELDRFDPDVTERYKQEQGL